MRNRSIVTSFALFAVVVLALALFIARSEPAPAKNSAPVASAATTAPPAVPVPADSWEPKDFDLGPPVPAQLMKELGKALGSAAGMRDAKKHYLEANRYPPGVVRVTPEMKQLLAPNHVDPVTLPLAAKGDTKPEDRLFVSFSTDIARAIGKDPVPLHLLVYRGEKNRTPVALKVLKTSVKTFSATGGYKDVDTFTLTPGGTMHTGTWVAKSGALDGFDGPLEFVVNYKIDGADEDAATVSVEYTHAAPGKITGIVSDALVDGSLEVTVSLDVTEPGRFNIDGRVFAADGKTPIAFSSTTNQLPEGPQQIKLVFYGLVFRDAKTAGPYVVQNITGFRMADAGTALGRGRQMQPYVTPYTTKPYSLDQMTDKEHDSPAKKNAIKALDDEIQKAEKKEKS
jgi:hypothetical protein